MCEGLCYCLVARTKLGVEGVNLRIDIVSNVKKMLQPMMLINRFLISLLAMKLVIISDGNLLK